MNQLLDYLALIGGLFQDDTNMFVSHGVGSIEGENIEIGEQDRKVVAVLSLQTHFTSVMSTS